jgi:hypothetical protein
LAEVTRRAYAIGVGRHRLTKKSRGRAFAARFASRRVPSRCILAACVALTAALSGCRSPSDAGPTSSETGQGSSGRDAATRLETEQVAFEFARVTQRWLVDFERPTGSSQPCEPLPHADAASAWVTLVQDERTRRPGPLPASLFEGLTTRELIEARALAATGSLGGAPRGASAWRSLAARPLALVFHVRGHSDPRVVYRVGHSKPEWRPGTLAVSLAVHDAESRRALCWTSWHVLNDVRSVPTLRRQRSAASERLERDLVERARGAAGVALDALGVGAAAAGGARAALSETAPPAHERTAWR